MLTAVLLLLLLLLPPPPLPLVPCPLHPRPTPALPPFLPLCLRTPASTLVLLIRVLQRLAESLMKTVKFLILHPPNSMYPGRIRHQRNHGRFRRPAHHRQDTVRVRRLLGDHHHRHPHVQVQVQGHLQLVPTRSPGQCLVGHVHSGEP